MIKENKCLTKVEVNGANEERHFEKNGLWCIYMNDGKNALQIFYYKFKPISKKRYLFLREELAPDMPPPLTSEPEPNPLAEWKLLVKVHHKDIERAKTSDASLLLQTLKYIPILSANDLVDNYILGTTSGRKALSWLNSLFAHSALSLHLDAEKFGVNVDSDRLICELPELPSQRKKIFEFAAKRSIDGGFDPVMDDGQRYLLIGFE